MNKQKKNRVLFITLKIFSATGGIEKVCRVMGKALHEISEENGGTLAIRSMHDGRTDAGNNNYFPARIFKGFGGNKVKSAVACLREGIGKDLVLLSHVNLLPVGWLIKKFSPRTRLALLAHGIEVWQPLKGIRKKMLHKCDVVIAVSRFTRERLLTLQQYPASECVVINNCLDPYLPAPAKADDIHALKEQYKIAPNDIVLFTLTRLAATERHKGYDTVLEAIKLLKDKEPGTVKYVIAGKYTEEEKLHIETLAIEAGLENNLVLTGYVADEALAAYFGMADIYVMPSNKEGFGIVFIEAMHYGLPVIAGNKDGSMDAILDGKLGTGVAPGNASELAAAIQQVLANRSAHIPEAALLDSHFAYPVYKKNIAAFSGQQKN